jgi:hypothetical protein
MILGMITNSKRPVSLGVADHLKREGTKADKLNNVTSVIGHGMERTYYGLLIRAGNPY